MQEKAQEIIDSLFGEHVSPLDWTESSVSKRYLVTRFGDVISLIRKPRILKKTKSPQGYFYVSLMVSSKPEKILIHRLVADCFVWGKTDLTKTVNHKDGNKENNYYLNLEWATYSENNVHAMDANLCKRFSETHYGAKLKNSDIPKIKEMRASGASITMTAKTFGVSRSQISSIISGRSWRRV
jgi:hypothetical protein